MTSTSAGIHESASTRALGMYDIVALIASYSPVWQPYGKLKSGWDNSGLQARGVNKLWKEAFEERIFTSTISEKYLAFSSDDYDRLPHPIIKILAGSNERLRRVRRLHAMCYPALSCNQEYIATIIVFTAPRLIYLAMDMGMLLALAEGPHQLSKVAFGKLRTLRLVLFHEEYAGDDLDVVRIKKVSDLLAIMSSLTAPEICAELDCEQDRGNLGWQPLHMLFSIPSAKIRSLELEIMSDKAILSASLAAILAHFKPKNLRLELQHSEGSVDLWDVLPPTISKLEYRSPAASASALLELLSDSRQLPMLSKIPMVEIETDEDAWADDDEMLGVTKEKVARAIKGMEDRGIEVNALQAANLYKLVNA